MKIAENGNFQAKIERVMQIQQCPLCENNGIPFFQSEKEQYYECVYCKGIFVPKHLLPGPQDEINRYISHNNDVEDPGYRQFVSPVVEEILQHFDASRHKGLDFGAGTGPVISKMLQDKDFKIAPYDPFFQDNRELLQHKYNFIACCEVMEHFHFPRKEFRRLKQLLLPGGKLFCMTHLYNPKIEFKNWYYKNDRTHVFIYQEETLKYIKEEFGFSDFYVKERLIVFSIA
ncbi:class I SAM-dependent methyltransferase [Autumnicola edwardsiae]|uniref:Class I SAM-dependent methyltransferase n=1 Tax=Autumnicola edwardsiae TaxID=3075594 RepID=A0ABU3CQN7_9FLAO|nr:class I SAM-dependent methyltransferase [Zunongwangia sp. F297]MDT0648626.1 class I SAM-dependent methyltransferase [Zunongwangia sp. F297]